MTAGSEDLGRKLDTLIRLVATAICAERPQKEKISILATAGLSTKEIAEFLGTTPNTVSVALSHSRKEKRGKVATRTMEINNE